MRRLATEVLLLLAVIAPLPRVSHGQFTSVPNCRARRNLDPTCASNNKTYANKDVFNCANKLANGTLTIVNEGHMCEEVLPVQVKQRMAKEDGSAEPATGEEKNVFATVDDCMAPKIFNPVCASNGMSYVNEAVFRCAQKLDANMTVAHRGHCSELLQIERKFTFHPKCMDVVPETFSPMCASDEKGRNSYVNEAVFLCINETANGSLVLEGFGHCNDAFPYDPADESGIQARVTSFTAFSDCSGSQKYAPLCGSDGRMYLNMEEFECANQGRDDLDMFVVDNSRCDLRLLVPQPQATTTAGPSLSGSYYLVLSSLVVAAMVLR